MDSCKRDNRLGLCAAFGLPLGAVLCLGLLSFDSNIYGHARLRWSLWGASLSLLVWLGWLCAAGRKPTVALRIVKAHYVQALIQLCIFAYWGWYWPPVYDMAPLIAAQIAFAYAFDALLCWSRRQEWHLGFRPFPIVLSMNLFIWFKFDWFALQLLMVATSLVGKEFFTWHRNGRSTHIFNPSGFALTAFSIALLTTGNTDLTCGEAIAKTLAEPEYIYIVVFALGLVVQCAFSVVLMTLAAVAALYVLSALYVAFFGFSYFADTSIPIGIFIGLHLLMTDPATSPRSGLGRLIFGALYGTGAFVLYGLLGWLEQPTFYDKLLCLPFLNLAVRAFDRCRLPALESLQRALRANAVQIGAWMAFFFFLHSTSFIGKKNQEGLAFWRGAAAHGVSTLVNALSPRGDEALRAQSEYRRQLGATNILAQTERPATHCGCGPED